MLIHLHYRKHRQSVVVLVATGVMVVNGNLCVADAWHHRVLVWDGIPTVSGTAPAYAIGQHTLSDAQPNRGGDVTASSLYWPYGIGWHAGIFWIADTGNRRVLGWHGLPTADQPATIVLGQPGFTSLTSAVPASVPSLFHSSHPVPSV